MIQEFGKSTMISKYIKYLLSHQQLPSTRIIFDGQYMHQGNFYVYKYLLIVCNTSGFFNSDNIYTFKRLTIEEALRVSDTARILRSTSNNRVNNVPLTVTDDYVSTLTPATYSVVDIDITDKDLEVAANVFSSTTDYYDSYTHEYLGLYLKWLRNKTGLNIMPLYNQFSNRYTDKIRLDSDSTTKKLKVVPVDMDANVTSRPYVALVPLSFDTVYTVAYESVFPTKVYPVLFGTNLLTNHHNLQDRTSTELAYMTQLLDFKPMFRNQSFFDKPFKVMVPSLSAEEYVTSTGEPVNLFPWERYLYLAIEMSHNNRTSIAVVEGDHVSHQVSTVFSAEGITTKVSEDAISDLSSGKLSLLQINDHKIHPFSDKLIEYLCGNTIDIREEISENVVKVQELLGQTKDPYLNWNRSIQTEIFLKYHRTRTKQKPAAFDVLGYVDSDIENVLEKGELNEEYS